MNQSHDFGEIIRRMDPHWRLVAARPLAGGVSAQTVLLDVATGADVDASTRKLVLRRHGAADIRANPQIAAQEFALLQRLHAAGLAVPKPFLYDLSGAVLPTSYIVLDYIDGTTAFPPRPHSGALSQMAAQLGTVHAVGCADPAIASLPRLAQRVTHALAHPPARLDASLGEGEIRAALTAAWPTVSRRASTLLHGDYWPGNVLWRGGRLVGVIDWEDAACGDPLADLANARLELLWALGPDAMDVFTRRYAEYAIVDLAQLPFWDLWAALRPASKLASWGLAAAVEQEMRDKHRWFVAHALASRPEP